MRQSDPNPNNHHHSTERGFTLVEAAIAMVIMMVAVLASASIFAYSIKNNSGASDRELAMAVAQQQIEQLRNARFTDAALTATTGVTTTITRAGRNYTVLTVITDSNTVNGAATMKTITVQVTPTGTTLGTVTLRTIRITQLDGPYR
ncbi:MAG TPA: prepilin-type N-terminal cleavage/methylation domain-containing protein [Pyrinomonadaceae bacterium]